MTSRVRSPSSWVTSSPRLLNGRCTMPHLSMTTGRPSTSTSRTGSDPDPKRTRPTSISAAPPASSGPTSRSTTSAYPSSKRRIARGQRTRWPRPRWLPSTVKDQTGSPSKSTS